MTLAKAESTKRHDQSPDNSLRDKANAIRSLAMDAVEKAQSGHPGMPMGMADVATVLYSQFLKFDPANPEWPDRDRFVLSAGHGSMLLYALNYLTGYKEITLDQIKNFRKLGAITAGHPEAEPHAGIETTTGPLGQGIATAAGMALAERLLNARFGDDLVDHKTYVIASDGDLMEGISHEACSLAGHLGLSKLIVLYDDNGISIDGPTSLSFSDNTELRFQSYGWETMSIDGHDFAQISSALTKAQKATKPVLICCKTHIGYGAPTKQDSASSHGSPLGAAEIEGARKALGWPHAPFEIPADIRDWWLEAGKRHAETQKDWTNKLANSPQKTAFQAAQTGDITAQLKPLIKTLKADFAAKKPKDATRKTSGTVLESIVPQIPEMVGGSADLTGSNNTIVKEKGIVSASNFKGQYIHYGVREHAMAAMMNGMALHRGLIPYSGTFLVFTDYCRPSIRLSALMKQRVIYVMTHDSIGLGEDGPTHQPVEHLASLRAIPNLNVFRPCDGIETAEAWEVALTTPETPSIMALTRQNLPTLSEDRIENKVARGAYVLKQSGDKPEVTLFASGSEVEIAHGAYEALIAHGRACRLVSVPCMDLLWQQPWEYIENLTCNSSIKVAVEAGIRQGWESLIGAHGLFIGMDGFGASAPYQDLYKHFGITAEAIVERVEKTIEARKANAKT
jgi:transketolase